MPTSLSFKDLIDLPKWRPLAPLPLATAAGVCISGDMRNSSRHIPNRYVLGSATAFYLYSPFNDEWLTLPSPALAGTFGAGAAISFHASQGPRGTLAAGNTTTSLVLSTALLAAVGINQLANRDDGVGFTVRVIGNAAGSSGKTEERLIVANTAGTTPTLSLDAPLSFSPAAGDAYEIRSGRVFLLSAGTTAAGLWKYYDVATNSFSGNLATANLPVSIGTDSSLVSLSEAYVPCDAADTSSGFFGVITSASGNTSTTLNTTTGVLPANLQANEYRNFQIRIVNDTAAPTAAGQRRRITSHTAGATAVFTVPTWTVTPSATASFVIENDDDKVLLFTANAAVYTYNIAANTWDTSTFAGAGVAGGTGVSAHLAFGTTRDNSLNHRHSFIYRLRGGNTNIMDVLDLAAAANGLWTADIAYGNKNTTFTTGSCGVYDPVCNEGRYIYLNVNGGQRFARFDLRNRVLEPWTYLRFPQGAAVVGNKLTMHYFFDGSTKLPFLAAMMNTLANMFSIACHR